MNEGVHIKPSVPGWRPIRFIVRISSRVMPSLPKRPPCVTKYRLKPSGERITPSFLAGGGSVALTRVARGTRVLCKRESQTEQTVGDTRVVKTCAKSCRKNTTVNGVLDQAARRDIPCMFVLRACVSPRPRIHTSGSFLSPRDFRDL